MKKLFALNQPIISLRELQRNYRKYFDYVKKQQHPVFFYKHNQPEGVLISLEMYQQAFMTAPADIPLKENKPQLSRVDELIGLFGQSSSKENLRKLAIQEWSHAD